MLGNRVFGAVASVSALLCISVVLFVSINKNRLVLDQYEPGEYETDPLESEATEREFDDAQPWRDPGHISREEIRFSRALRSLDTVPRDSTWKAPGLWTKYDEAMENPTEVKIGWSNPRVLTPGADPLQRAVERNGYGAEGHREPERSWSLDDDEDSDVNNLLEERENADMLEKKRGYLARLIGAIRAVASSAGFDAYSEENTPRRARPLGDDEVTADLVREMQGLRADVHGISQKILKPPARKPRRKSSKLGQQLAASVAEVKALEDTDKGLEKDDAAQKRRLDRLEAALRELTKRAAAPAASAQPVYRRRRTGLTDMEAARDLSDYFDRMGAQVVRNSAAHVQSELAMAQQFGTVAPASPSAATPAAPAAKARPETLAELVKGL